jgi:hypothetical protein
LFARKQDTAEGDAVKKDTLPTRDFAFAANVRLSDQFEDGSRN